MRGKRQVFSGLAKKKAVDLRITIKHLSDFGYQLASVIAGNIAHNGQRGTIGCEVRRLDVFDLRLRSSLSSVVRARVPGRAKVVISLDARATGHFAVLGDSQQPRVSMTGGMVPQRH